MQGEGGSLVVPDERDEEGAAAPGGGEEGRPPPSQQAPLGSTEKEGCRKGRTPLVGRRQPLVARRRNADSSHGASSSSSYRRRGSLPPPFDPFAGRDLFPPLEEAFRIPDDDDEEDDDDDGQSSDVSLNLSIGARAALHEHLRHVARFGIDGGQTASGSASAAAAASVVPPAGPGRSRGRGVDPRDEEWERLNRSASDDDDDYRGYGNAESDSGEATPDREQDDADDEGSGEALEVHTDLSTDYFNSSRVRLLLTPEKARNRPGQHVTTTRGNRSYETSSGSGSVLSSSILLDEGQSVVFDSDLGHGGGFDDDDEDGNSNNNNGDADDDRARHYHSLFLSDVEGGGVDVSFSAILHDVSRISALDVSHISADGSVDDDAAAAGERSVHFFGPPSPSAAPPSPSLSVAAAAARTPPRRPALRAIHDSRATIDDELAKVVLYSSPQRLPASRRIPSPRRVADPPSRRAHIWPSNHEGASTPRSEGVGGGGGNSSSRSSNNSNATSDDEYGIRSRGDSAGYRADREYSVSTATNDGRGGIQYVALSPTSTQASPAAGPRHASIADSSSQGAARRVSGTAPAEFCDGDDAYERQLAGGVDARERDSHVASSLGRMKDGGSGLLTGRLTRTLSSHEHVEVVVVYDLAHNSLENDSDVSSLHNHSSSYDKTNSGASRSDSAADGTASATERSPLCSRGERATTMSSPGPPAPGRGMDDGDRRRYRTVVPSRVFLDLGACPTGHDDAMYPEPYDSFLSNPSSAAASSRQQRPPRGTAREPDSLRSAPT